MSTSWMLIFLMQKIIEKREAAMNTWDLGNIEEDATIREVAGYIRELNERLRILTARVSAMKKELDRLKEGNL